MTLLTQKPKNKESTGGFSKFSGEALHPAMVSPPVKPRRTPRPHGPEGHTLEVRPHQGNPQPHSQGYEKLGD
jgi:hypothetical protein